MPHAAGGLEEVYATVVFYVKTKVCFLRTCTYGEIPQENLTALEIHGNESLPESNAREFPDCWQIRELTTTPTPTTKTNTPTKFPTDAPGAGAGLAPSLLALVTLLFVF